MTATSNYFTLCYVMVAFTLTIGQVAGAVTGALGWTTSVIAIYKWRVERKEKRAEKAAKEKAETELKEIRRRSTDLFPYFIVSETVYNSIMFPTGKPGSYNMIHPFSSQVLSSMSPEAGKDSDGEEIYLLIDNRGSDAYEIKIELDGERAFVIAGAIDGLTRKVTALCYKYSQEHHGKAQTLKIGFLASNGVREVQSYATRHGMRVLRRIDPA